jgi:RNA polymerase sigma-70 factor (ECF subfamily)
MASGAGDQVDLAAGLESRPVREQSAPEIAEDAVLVSAARDGDRAAFGRLYDRYARMVHGVLLAKAPVGEVDDLVQDVFLLALRRLSTLREAGSFGAWLAAIARNLANDYHRHSVPEDQLGDDASENEIERGNIRRDDQISDDQSAAVAILDVIRTLPDAYRETLILRLVEGMTGPEIAARTGLTHGSVRVNLHRGMQQLRAKLSPSASSDEPGQATS